MRSRNAALAIALLAAATAAAADEYPTLKAGQWEMLTSSSKSANNTPVRTTLCTDASVQKEMMEMGAGIRKDICSKADIRRDGNRYTTDSVCKLGVSKITSHSVMTMQGDNGYRTEVSATYDPPFMGMKDSATTVEGKYVGACKDGLQPGDFVTATGQKFNIKGIVEQKSGMPPPTKK